MWCMFVKLFLSSLETRTLMLLHERDTFLLKGGGAVKEASYYLYLIFKLKKWSEVKVTQSCPILCNPMDYRVHGILQARILEWVAFPFLRGHLPNPGIEHRSPALKVDSLPAEPTGKPKNTGVGGLSLLQGIFLTQESNQSLLHCRQILYQLSYQGSLKKWTEF